MGTYFCFEMLQIFTMFLAGRMAENLIFYEKKTRFLELWIFKSETESNQKSKITILSKAIMFRTCQEFLFLMKMQFRPRFSGFSDVTFMWIYWRFERISRASGLNISVVFHSIGKPKAPTCSGQVAY